MSDQPHISMTAQQRKLLIFIEDYATETGICPSYAEMAAAMGTSSKSGINRLVIALEERRFIRRHHGRRARSIDVLV